MGATIALPLVAVAVLGVEVELARRGDELTGAPLTLDGFVGSGTGEPVRMAWLGDSTAAGVGAMDPGGALPRQVASRLGRPVELVVLARSGARVAEVADDQVGRVAAGRPDLVVVSVGANDVTHLTSAGAFRRSYEELLDRLDELGSVEVVVLGVPDMGSPPRLAQPLRFVAGVRGGTLDAVVREVARDHGVGYVDIAGETGPAFRRRLDLFSADRYHPDRRGYEVWADAVVPVVRARLMRR